ncbi:MAG TPA: hypothetical protein VE991_12940 [Acidimicrobiales bacterium]|nr:hypothetical protein [Acidimicrobiales bacterium]
MPAGVPLLGRVAFVGPRSPSPSAVAAEIRAYERALAGLGVGMLRVG